MKNLSIMSLLTLMLFSINSQCETVDTQHIEPQPDTLKSELGSIYLSLGTANFNSKQASNEKIDDSATEIRIGGELQNQYMIYGGGMSVYQYKDGAGFSQYVQDLSGNTSTASSDASSFNLYGEFGYALNLSPAFRVDLMGGYEHILESSRSIPNCSNCDKKKIDIKSGLYFSPRLRYVADTGNAGHILFVLSYSKGVSTDIENAILLTVGFGGI